MWIFPKIANFGVFDRFLAKNALELSGDAVPTEHQIHRKGVIFGEDRVSISKNVFNLVVLNSIMNVTMN